MRARILVVDDDLADLELASHLFKVFGYELLTAHDGETGLTLALRERPDLIVCDIQLPRMDGCELARRIRAEPLLRGVPLLAVTGFAGHDTRKLMKAGFDMFIPKPLDPDRFVQQVATMLPPRPTPRPTATAAQPLDAPPTTTTREQRTRAGPPDALPPSGQPGREASFGPSGQPGPSTPNP